jgi:hypothetical protein
VEHHPERKIEVIGKVKKVEEAMTVKKQAVSGWASSLN